MGSLFGPMPPPPDAPVTSQALAVFAAWVDAGMPSDGFECDGGLDLGDGGRPFTDAGILLRASAQLWNSQADPPDLRMYPGRACIQCHTELNLVYQRFGYAGSVMTSAHESDRCDSPPPADGGWIEILEPDGGRLQLLVGETGNFDTRLPLAAPYVARLVAHGAVKISQTAHLDGDGNACHSEAGAQGAPGRLTFP